MADRTAGKVKKQAKKAPARTTSGAGSKRSRGGPTKQVNLAAECERLRAELEAAKARIQAMEAQRKELLDRVNWAIDSLTSMNDA